MATKQGINAGNAFIQLFLDDSDLVPALNKAARVIRRASRQLAIVGGAITAPFALALRAFAEAGRTMTGFGNATRSNALAAVAFSEAWENTKKHISGLAIAIGAALAPALEKLLAVVTVVADWLSKFVDRHRTLVVIVAIAGVALLGLAAIGYVVAAAFAVASTALLYFQIVLAALTKSKIGLILLLVGALVALAIALVAIKTIGIPKIPNVGSVSVGTSAKSVFGGKLAEQVIGANQRDDSAKLVAEAKDQTIILASIRRKMDDVGVPVGDA